MIPSSFGKLFKRGGKKGRKRGEKEEGKEKKDKKLKIEILWAKKGKCEIKKYFVENILGNFLNLAWEGFQDRPKNIHSCIDT